MEKTRKNNQVRIPALARVEGHGNILVEFAKGKVKTVNLNIPEGPRLFETLVVGKTPEEVVNIVPRICAICSVSHRYAAIRALERALDMKETKATNLLRTLMHYGEMIESHSLHAYVLALPDFLGYPSAIAMVDPAPISRTGKKETESVGLRTQEPENRCGVAPQVLKALKLKKFGNYIMEVVTARWTHGENPTVGGFGAAPTHKQLLDIKKQAEALIPEAEELVELMRNLHYPTAMEDGMVFMCLKPPTEKYGFVGDSVLVSTGEEHPIEKYKELCNERIVARSTAKRCRYNDKPFVVGALARMNLLGERLHGKASQCFKRCYSLSWIRNPLYGNLAQAIEILFCLEQTPKVIDELLKKEKHLESETSIKKPSIKTGKNVGAVEAPRGTLYHYYELKRGLVTDANLITPTTQNLDAMETHIRVAAQNLVANTAGEPRPCAQGRGESEQTSSTVPQTRKNLELILEMIVRSYDPCISCSVHVVEQY